MRRCTAMAWPQEDEVDGESDRCGWHVTVIRLSLSHKRLHFARQPAYTYTAALQSVYRYPLHPSPLRAFASATLANRPLRSSPAFSPMTSSRSPRSRAAFSRRSRVWYQTVAINPTVEDQARNMSKKAEGRAHRGRCRGGRCRGPACTMAYLLRYTEVNDEDLRYEFDREKSAPRSKTQRHSNFHCRYR
jgi:hypothetical protein